MEIIDISQEVLSCAVYPGDPAPHSEKLSDMNNGACYNLSTISMCAHNGTHIDAPLHFINDGKTISDIPLESVVGSCYVAKHSGNITANDAKTILKKAHEYGADERCTAECKIGAF